MPGAGIKRTPLKARKSSTGRKKKARVTKRLVAPRAESKFHDVTVVDLVVVEPSAMQGELLIIPQGTTEAQRVGRKITITSIHMYAVIALRTQTDLTIGSELFRIIMFQDKQANGALPVTLDLLETDFVESFRNLSNSGRFNFLYDEFHTLNALAAAGNGTADATFEMLAPHIQFHKECKIPIEYDNQETTGLINTIRSNNIGLLFLTLNGSITGIDAHLRFRFVDG